MNERPILFSGPMVRALLEGRKTVTRRITRLPPGQNWTFRATQPGSVVFGDTEQPLHVLAVRCPYGEPGDRLWVRETWYDDEPGCIDPTAIDYRATHECRKWEAGCPCNPDGDGKRSAWRPSIYMPRWASRLTLEVVDVRVERLHQITDDDARREGVDDGPGRGGRLYPGTGAARGPLGHRVVFSELWDSLNAKRAPWASNPWVWRVEFKRVS